jgi:hypothetical protein
MYDLELSRRQCIIKSSRATSRVKWLKYENTDVSRSLSVLVLRVLKWLKVKVKVTLRLTVSQPVRLGVEPRLGLMTRC